MSSIYKLLCTFIGKPPENFDWQERDKKKNFISHKNITPIDFYNKMLSWPRGGIKEDGVWAKHWYKNVHQSTGFMKQKTSKRELPKHCEALYFDALKYYNKLSKNSLKV